MGYRSLPRPSPLTSPPAQDDKVSRRGIDAATAFDLDLLGAASLEQLLGTPNTPVGKTTVRHWILQPADPETVRQRQSAVAELGPQVVFREEVALRGRLVGATQQEYERLIAWAESPAWLHEQRVLVWVTRLLPLVVVGLTIALVAGWPVLPALMGVFAINLALAYSIGRRVNDDIAQVVARQHVFDAYADAFGLIVSRPFAAPELKRLQAALEAHGHQADDQIRRLARLMPLADVRRSIYFFPIDIATLWSFHLLWQLENWKLEAGRQLRGWLAALGELEALAALATLHHDEPEWVLPEVIDSGAMQFVAKDLTHPLLPPACHRQ
ncbi:MAG: hypothetical protein IPK16_02880 [Anaerolineales bacterium]|nr:hypothetical protein [Anaerolineales bacterium]